MAAGEPDPRGGGRVRGAAPGGPELGRSAVALRGPHGDGTSGPEPDEHLQRVAAPGVGQRRRGGCRGRAGADGAGPRGAGHTRQARSGRDGRAVSGGGCGPPGRAPDHPALARDARGAGAARREDRRHRHALRRTPSARRDPLMRVAVITGGATAERAVAFAGAAQIVEALRGRGHTLRAVDTVTGLLSSADEQRLLTTTVGREPPAVAELDERERAMLSNGLARLPEVAGAGALFRCVHAGRGEGGILQAVLGVIGVPYTGSGALASALAMDKDLSKRLFRAAGVPVPAWFMAPVAAEDVTTALGWPVIVKPSRMGSSVGMTLVRNAEALDAAVALARTYDVDVMAEQFIPGRELAGRVGGGPRAPGGGTHPEPRLYQVAPPRGGGAPPQHAH